jgi:LuxR family maltose regulon positive regulatory protein
MGDQVPRDLLLTRLDGVLDCRLTLVHAPAGYGKTSLLSQWCRRARNGVRIAWVSLKRDDADLRRLTRYILLALDQTEGQDEPGEDERRVSANLPPRAAVSAIINRLSREAGPVVLILDDFHLVESPEIDAVIRPLISLAPANCHFIVSSRDCPWLGQSILAAEEQLLELTAQDLRFSPVEAALLLRQTMGDAPAAALTDEDLRGIVERTEGWPIALKLAWLSLKRGADHRELLDQFRSPTPELARYLSQQVLDTMPEETQQIVMRTSLLDRLTGDLVNLLCDRTDGWLMLERLEEQGIFLTPLDSARRAYRYHQLFAEHMRERIERGDGTLYRMLHRRAAQWFAARGEVAEAVSHAIQGDDDAMLATIMEDAGGGRLIPYGQQPTVERGLAKLSAAMTESRPRLVLARVYLEIKRGELASARADYNRFVARLGEADLSADEWTEVRVVGDVLADYENEPVTLDDLLAREALLRTLPTNDHLILANLGETLAAQYYEGGWLERALEPALTAREHHKASGSLYSGLFTRFWESRIRRAQARFKDAAAILAAARADIETNFGLRSDLAANCAAYEAELLYDQNDRAGAFELLGWAVPHMEQSDGWVDVYAAAHFTAARISASEGMVAAALAMVARAHGLAQRRRLRQLELLSLLCELDIRIDHDPTLEGARSFAARIGLVGLTDGAADGVPLYRSVITAAALCRSKLHLIGGDYDAALSELGVLRGWAVQHGAARVLIDINILLAHALRETGRRSEAQACFNDAVGTAMFQGIMRPFIDKARFAAPSLNDALRSDVPPDRLRAQFLRDMARGLSAQRADGTSPRLLSEAEKEVLRHVSLGHSNREIAGLIGMSHDTVKYRLKSVFRKIRVETREDAVRVARERGLISGDVLRSINS